MIGLICIVAAVACVVRLTVLGWTGSQERWNGEAAWLMWGVGFLSVVGLCSVL